MVTAVEAADVIISVPWIKLYFFNIVSDEFRNKFIPILIIILTRQYSYMSLSLGGQQSYSAPGSCLYPYFVPIPCTHTLYPYLVPIPCTHTLYPYLVPIPCTHALYPYLVPIPYTHTLYPYLTPIPCTHTLYCNLFLPVSGMQILHNLRFEMY